MDLKYIKYEKKDHLAYITFNRPEVMNSMHPPCHLEMDSIWDDSYNHCKMEVQEQIISEDLEFYHDNGGLLTSKTKLIAALKNNICGKVTRELLKGSIEVYPIKDYGAVEMGYHRFHNINDTNQNSHFARFVHIWKKENGAWKITRVISLH